MDVLSVVLVGLCIAVALLPPKWDPAVKLKEFNEAWAKRLEKK